MSFHGRSRWGVLVSRQQHASHTTLFSGLLVPPRSKYHGICQELAEHPDLSLEKVDLLLHQARDAVAESQVEPDSKSLKPCLVACEEQIGLLLVDTVLSLEASVKYWKEQQKHKSWHALCMVPYRLFQSIWSGELATFTEILALIKGIFVKELNRVPIALEEAQRARTQCITLLGAVAYQADHLLFEEAEEEHIRGLVSTLNSTYKTYHGDVAVVVEEETSKWSAMAAICACLESSKRFSNDVANRNRPPSKWITSWVPAIIGLPIVYTLLRSWKKHDVSGMIEDAVLDMYFTARNFTADYILLPAREIYETIRYEEIQMAVMSAQSLENEVESLKRMVADFAQHYSHLDESTIEEIMTKAGNGDISPVMQRFEDQIKSPFISLFLDNMLRTILIQVQKSKVDVGYAMAAMDKMMRSNELNFEIFSLLPGLFITYQLFGWIFSFFHVSKKRAARKLQLKLQPEMLQLAHWVVMSGRRNLQTAEELEGEIVFATNLILRCVGMQDEHFFRNSALNILDLRDSHRNHETWNQRLAIVQLMMQATGDLD